MTGLTAAEAALVRRAREMSADEFMRGQVEAFRRRRGARRAALIVRGEPVACAECAALGASAEESFAIHHPELLPGGDGEQAGRSAADSYDAEITRLLSRGYSLATAEAALNGAYR